MKLKLIRSGVFVCHWKNSDNVCGTSQDLIRQYRYECQIHADTQLDEHGFLIDQLELDRYFQTKYSKRGRKPLSCELIAINSVNDIRQILEDDLVFADTISVTIGVVAPRLPKGLASMTAEWRRQ